MMTSRPRTLAAGLVLALAAVVAPGRAALAQAAGPSAPGASAPATVHPPISPADVAFMSGMIAHHRQALLMAGWAPTHGAGSGVRELCERIAVSQRDEIASMARWLRDHHAAVPDTATPTGYGMPDMPGMGVMDRPALMPGMLTDAQLARLDSARGPDFDRLFLTDMIQHHQGALAMVQQLVSTPGAAQDGFVFQFASDVNADQSAEIDRMQRMLAVMFLGR